MKTSSKLAMKEISKLIGKYKEIFESRKIISELFPQQFKNSSDLTDYLGVTNSEILLNDDNVRNSIHAGINEPCWSMISRGGKRWRPIYGLMIGKFLGLDIESKKGNDTLFELLGLVELLHNASLIIDDIVDNSEFRRGKECVHKLYGMDISINAGCSMYFYPMKKILANKPVAMQAHISQVYFDEMMLIHTGQGLDCEMKVESSIPFVQNYIDIVLCKTGVFPRMISKLVLGCFNEDPVLYKKFIELSNSFSVAFQVKDDLLNICDEKLAKGKGFMGEDLYEGKITLMVIKCLEQENSQDAARLKEILLEKTKDEKKLQEGIQILTNSGAINFAENIMNDYIEKADRICDEIYEYSKDKNYNTDAILDINSLTNYLINRNI